MGGILRNINLRSKAKRGEKDGGNGKEHWEEEEGKLPSSLPFQLFACNADLEI